MRDENILRWVDTKWSLISKSDDLLAELTDDYIQVNGQTPCCLDTLSEFHKSILSQYEESLLQRKNKIEMSKSEKKYLLKDGLVLYYAPAHAHFTNANISDEMAEKMLKHSPGLASNFARLPDELPQPEIEPASEVVKMKSPKGKRK